MSVFDTYADNPFKIRDDGQEITVHVKRTGPTTIRVSWTLPNVVQCGQDSAYNGALITIDTTPTAQSKLPVDGTEYNADNTASPTLNAGDTIGTALVIGAFYNNKHICHLDVTDAPSATPFYVSLHAVDAQYRYHTAGVQSYSLEFGKDHVGVPTPGSQVVRFGSYGVENTGPNGVTLSTATNLNGATTYSFKLDCDTNHRPQHTGYTFTTTGAQSPTYGDLLTTLNAQVISGLNPTYGTVLLGTNYYWYDSVNKQVDLWNGTANVIQDAIIVGQDPINPSNNTYWYNQTAAQLFQFATGTGYAAASFMALKHDPRQPMCDDFWYKSDTNAVYRWNGTIWQVTPFYNQVNDPARSPATTCGSYWYNGTQLYHRADHGCMWNLVSFFTSPTDITQPVTGALWINTLEGALYEYDGTSYQVAAAFLTKPTVPATGSYYLDNINEIVEVFGANGWTPVPATIVTPYNPTTPDDGAIWNSSTGFQMWDVTTNAWVAMTVTTSAIDPTLPPVLAQGTVWLDSVSNLFYKLVGTSWENITGCTAISAIKPQNLTTFVWYNTTTKVFSQLSNGMLTTFVPVLTDFSPADIAIGRLWYNTTAVTLNSWDGTEWVVLPINSASFQSTVTVGSYFYNTNTSVLSQWNGKTWITIQAPITFTLNSHGNLQVTSSTLGSKSWVHISQEGITNILFNPLVLGIAVHLEHHKKGTDPVSTVPSYLQQGVGTDGSQDERRNLAKQIKQLLGYPIVEVELTKEQIDTAIDNALMELRYKSGAGYKRGMFFLDVEPHVQHYILSDATVGFNKVVEILYLHRMTSAYLGTGVGAGVYGQIAIQQLYTYGKFDLVSYHLVAGYIELMKQLFATEIQFSWEEYSRKLSIYKDFWIHERVLVDAVLEKTEQEILVDRWTAKWVQKYALAQCRLMLAEIRGKYTSVVAAGGQVTMNAAELRAAAEREMQECQDDIDNYIVSNKEDWGAASDFIIG